MEVVPDAVMPVTEEWKEVVINQQEGRKERELDSPNAELFGKLSELYNTDIQELSQVINAAYANPKLSNEAIEIIKASRMFKHKQDVYKTTPWFWNNQEFLDFYQDDVKALHCLYSQFHHYDQTIIPCYKELFYQMVVTDYFKPRCEVVEFLKNCIQVMLEEAIECRKRLEDMYIMMKNERKESFKKFTDEYGEYAGYHYEPQSTDISFLLNDII